MLFILAIFTLKGITKTGSYRFILFSEVKSFLYRNDSQFPDSCHVMCLHLPCHVISFTATSDSKWISVIFATSSCHGHAPLCGSIFFTSDIIWLFTLALCMVTNMAKELFSFNSITNGRTFVRSHPSVRSEELTQRIISRWVELITQPGRGQTPLHIQWAPFQGKEKWEVLSGPWKVTPNLLYPLLEKIVKLIYKGRYIKSFFPHRWPCVHPDKHFCLLSLWRVRQH